MSVTAASSVLIMILTYVVSFTYAFQASLHLCTPLIYFSRSIFDPMSSSLYALPSHLGEVALPVTKTMNIPEIMNLLQETYPEGSGPDQASQKPQNQWAKTRSYLYHYRVSAQRTRNTNIHTTNTTNTETPKPKRVRIKDLSLQNILQILSFLQISFPNHPHLQARILQNSPRILSQYHSIESRLLPTLEFLKGLYGNMPDSKGREGGMIYEAIWRNTNLLLVRGVGYIDGGWGEGGGEDDIESSADVERYLGELGVSSLGMAKLKKNNPTLFQLSLKQRVKPVVDYLSSLLGYESTTTISLKYKNQLSKILINHPMLLQLDVDSNLSPTARFIQTFCCMTEEELAAVVATTPGILCLSLERNLTPTLELLLDALTPTANKHNTNQTTTDNGGKSILLLRKCILKHPQILALSLENLRGKMDYFNEIDRLGDNVKKKASLAAKILVAAPSVYSLSLNNIAEKIEYLAALWGSPVLTATWPKSDTLDGIHYANCPHIKRASLSDNLREYPQILTLSMEGNIKPTLAFYNMSGYIQLTPDGLPNTHNSSTMQFPSMIRGRYIATSLYNRLLPRWHYLTLNPCENQTIASIQIIPAIHPEPSDTGKKALAELPPLHLLAGANDEVFCRQMDIGIDEYLTFKKAVGPQLEFNSQFEIWLQTGRPIRPNSAP